VNGLPQAEVGFKAWFLFDVEIDNGETTTDIFLARE